MQRFDLRVFLAVLLVSLQGMTSVRADDEPTGDFSAEVDFELLDSVGEDQSTFTFEHSGPIDIIDITLDFTTTHSSTWAGDITMALVDPNGTAVEWGGYDVWFGYLENPPNFESSWNTSTPGEYSASFDFSGFGLEGDGQWELKVMNGYANSTNGDWSGMVTFSTCSDCLQNDCNQNGIDDSEDISGGGSEDCDGNGQPDECQIDCNDNGVIDACEDFEDCNGNGVPDECDTDCNNDGIPDDCDAEGVEDCDGNGVPDECDPDCNGNGIPDGCDLDEDCDGNGVPDSCQPDCDFDGIPDACEPDDDGNNIPNDCEPVVGGPIEFNLEGPGSHKVEIPIVHNGPIHQIEIEMDFSTDDVWTWAGDIMFVIEAANGASVEFGSFNYTENHFSLGDFPSSMNTSLQGTYSHVFSMPAETDGGAGEWTIRITNGFLGSSHGHWAGTIEFGQCGNCFLDCNENGLPDDQEIASGMVSDCNYNNRPDSCDLANNGDLNGDGYLDSCQTDCSTFIDFNYTGLPGESMEIPFEFDGTPGLLTVDSGFRNVNNDLTWASDLLISLVDPSGNAIELGGYDLTHGHLLVGTFPGSWESYMNGQYPSATFDLGMEGQVSGAGTWTLVVSNGYSGSRGGQWIGSMNICKMLPMELPEDGPDISDEEDSGYPLSDCNANGIEDASEIANDLSLDCNLNGMLDSCDIAQGDADVNGNQRPDSCELLAGDFNLDGCVDGQDLGLFYAAWGTVNPPYGDMNGDGFVDNSDLGLFLAYMGNCN
ncbi:MAG: hypothetical protein MK085_00540 [Phycisphaerales bacterium]|nr:hypothetical protein [Phycisphaerales bacterium]